MTTKKQNQILKEVGNAAYNKRVELIAKFKKQKKGNVKVVLPHGFCYVYGETIKNPDIVFPSGQTMNDMEFWGKTIWSK